MIKEESKAADVHADMCDDQRRPTSGVPPSMQLDSPLSDSVDNSESDPPAVGCYLSHSNVSLFKVEELSYS